MGVMQHTCVLHVLHVLHITILLVVDPLSSSAYPMMTHPSPVPSNLPIKTLVARQLPTSMYITCELHVCNKIVVSVPTTIATDASNYYEKPTVMNMTVISLAVLHSTIMLLTLSISPY